MDSNTQKKLTKLQELLKKKVDIEREISSLLAPEKNMIIPPNFSVNSEVFNVIANAGTGGIHASNIVTELVKKWPDYGIDRKRVASALAYLKNEKKQIESVGRGTYRVLLNNSDKTESATKT